MNININGLMHQINISFLKMFSGLHIYISSEVYLARIMLTTDSISIYNITLFGRCSEKNI